jgi:hypothetical protein
MSEPTEVAAPTRRGGVAAGIVLASAVLLAVVLATLLGWVTGAQLRHSDGPPLPRIASVGPFRLQLDGDWRPTAPRRALAGDDLGDLRVYAQVAALPGRIWIARAPVTTPSLVPATVLHRLDGRLGAPRRAKLAGRPAWVYDAVAVRGGGLLELTAQPTSAGVLLVGCEAGEAWWASLADCARGVASIDGPRSLPPSTDLAYRLHARGPLARLNALRAREGRKLHRARRARAQARSARRLAAAHARAAAALRPYSPREGAPHRVIGALRRSRAAYAAIAHAAQRVAGGRSRRGARRRYAVARRHARRADAALAHALRRAAAG